MSDGRGRANWFNYINMTSHDPSGMLRFVTDELQDAEEAGDRGQGGVFHARAAFADGCRSLDHGPCPRGMGRYQRAGKPHRFVYVFISRVPSLYANICIVYQM